jgi:hypothetical protein
MLHVIGFEGRAPAHYPLVWGAAALRDETEVLNAVTGLRLAGNAAWERYIEKGVVTALEIEVPVTRMRPYYVMSVLKELAEQDPYRIGSVPRIHQVEAIGHGPSRTYLVFDSHQAVERWLYHLLAGPYRLVAV